MSQHNLYFQFTNSKQNSKPQQNNMLKWMKLAIKTQQRHNSHGFEIFRVNFKPIFSRKKYFYQMQLQKSRQMTSFWCLNLAQHLVMDYLYTWFRHFEFSLSRCTIVGRFEYVRVFIENIWNKTTTSQESYNQETLTFS